MKIALPTEGNQISGHFGKCENFTIVDIQNAKAMDKAVISTEGNQHGSLPAFLASKDVSIVIAGGMGEGARQGLANRGIQAITGITGSVNDAVDAYLSGNLKSTNAGCSGHAHHECNCGH